MPAPTRADRSYRAPCQADEGTQADEQRAADIRARYRKHEYRIPMRDGVRLFTTVYAPADDSKRHPFLLTRTPYGVAPYGADAYARKLGSSKRLESEGFIFVFQDARGRNMSEGTFVQLRPHVPEKRSPGDVDDSSDTRDTIDWLLANVPNHNGRVGMTGISQAGFHAAASALDAHPALVAVSPQAPVVDYYAGDDAYHNGALMLAANFAFYTQFQPREGAPQPLASPAPFDYGTPDGYQFYLGVGPLETVNERLLSGRGSFFQEVVDHPTYDSFWQARALWRHVSSGVRPAWLIVGGWFDAENLTGALRLQRAVATVSAQNTWFVMGPWYHTAWANSPGDRLGNLDFGFCTAQFFREQIELPWFLHQLQGRPLPDGFAKVYAYVTGANEFRQHTTWPPDNTAPLTLELRADGALGLAKPESATFDEYVSDPRRPVPFVGYVVRGMTYDYMTEDQRFASYRPDVLVYASEPLTEDLVVAGAPRVDLTVSTSGTDSDFVVKLVDVYPADFGKSDDDRKFPSNLVRLGGYQQLVRGEPFRAKFRHGFERPEPMRPHEPERVTFVMPDIYHAFRRGHRIMIQIQSSWFPLVDRNPQRFMTIAKARPEDFQSAVQRVYHGGPWSSSITLAIESGRFVTAAAPQPTLPVR